VRRDGGGGAAHVPIVLWSRSKLKGQGSDSRSILEFISSGARTGVKSVRKCLLTEKGLACGARTRVKSVRKCLLTVFGWTRR